MQGIDFTDMRHAQLKAFHAVAKYGGFSKAAERLRLTQPAVSGHVRNLEETYGVPLIDRSTAGVSLTATGRKLYALAERQFEIEAEAIELLSRGRRLEEGQLILGADAAAHALPLVARFRAAYPRISVRLEAGNSSELIARLEAFRIDAAVVAEAPTSDDFAVKQLRRNRLVVILAADHPVGRTKSLSLAGFVKLPIVLREEGSFTRRLLLDELRKRGLSFETALEIETREAAREAVAQGLGAAVLSEAELLPDPRVVALPFTDWPAEMGEWLITLKARQQLHIIRALWMLVET